MESNFRGRTQTLRRDGCRLSIRALRVRVAYLQRTEGPRGVLAGALRRVNGLRRRFFTVERYVLYTFDTDVGALPQRLPPIEGLEVVVLESEADVDALATRGFEVLDFHPSCRREWLRRGGVAFCAYVNLELAHIAWVAMRADARGCCDSLPYHVDFERGEANWGGSYTWPRFRGRGIYAYVCGIRLSYLHEKGYSRARDAVAVRNLASMRGQSWWNPTPCMRGRLVRFLGRSTWRESPLERVGR